MRLQSIELQWFRGGAAHAELPLNGKSTVVFGPNGSGKSSFVDGLEVLLCRGRVDHLSHEYAGRNQENGLINTARPDGQETAVRATLADGSSEKLTWRTGAPVHSRDGATPMGWEYRRTALRQEDLKVFITAAKREKYSACPPSAPMAQI